MLVNGCDCSIVIKTTYRETGIPYAEETIREAVIGTADKKDNGERPDDGPVPVR
jgi:hypothetical protein